DDGRCLLRAGAELREEVDAALAGQHHVEDDRLGVLLHRGLGLARVGRLDVAVAVAEGSLDQLPEWELVVADQDEWPQRARCFLHPENLNKRSSRRGLSPFAVTVRVPRALLY